MREGGKTLKSKPHRFTDEFLQKELDRVFDSFVEPHQTVTAESTHWLPPMDIYETVDNFIVKIEVAGIKPEEDVRIQLNQNILKITGYRRDRTQLKKQHYHQAELNYGPFERSIVLPNVLAEDVEPKANYENGFLEIQIPKIKQDPPKEIVVQVNEGIQAIQPVNEEQKELNHGKEEERE